ncbi:MAG: transcriptional coactivator p15 [Candidatus Brocadia sp. AMX2]|uniref:Transcriptional co activator P15 n=1 Tax=Candidatus Brocadia sinica JPN1 TaxID=1197129 RepID=A0ABQ0JYG0_9BACT|nr:MULTISPECIES: transcriptional coactivator p15/PC4 family protein [Brocadia]MBC6932882.1 transcriptional coactivator p15 [Candidatus Brocadia sp.]MBL1167632.1 transcriptional coactivator p15 [Candidatus Brocadia sp. AMX1]NOG40476.1 transcriptional coactivator p15 [Planctomycetota bacterium]NUO06272.1 transcriptional coactivator p15 [Candidatus Brocadia sinica]KAA0242093.1 MAG: transcriptional coactivator p15 [Candidatus Brocadia sp. AMX2]
MEQLDTVLGEIVKSETDKIVIGLKEYRGHKYVDMRTFFQGDDGNYLPTKKGITFSPKFIEAMIKILQKGAGKTQ